MGHTEWWVVEERLKCGAMAELGLPVPWDLARVVLPL